MGRIKSKIVKRTALTLLKEAGEKFKNRFEDNKKLLAGITESKKVRNQIAGYITRIKKREIQNKISK